MHKGKIASLIVCIAALSACAPDRYEDAVLAQTAPIYPDYTNVTVPVNIAPLNFHYVVPGVRSAKTVCSTAGTQITIKGKEVNWTISKWKQLLDSAQGDTLHFSATLKMDKGPAQKLEWFVAVSEDRVDPYLTYRLIEPGYEVWSEVEIVERNVENFEERILSDYRNTNNACMNCHIHGQNRGDLSIMYVRGPKGGAFLNKEGVIRKLTLKNADMISPTVYGELHPSGDYGVFSTNIIIPGFHSYGARRLEVYDTKSDVIACDFAHNRIITSPLLQGDEWFETFPAFSPDGKTVYFCRAKACELPRGIPDLKYDLCAIDFDAQKGEFGRTIRTVWSAAEHNASVCHPKVSPDGKWLMYTVADYGTFPIWHQECRLEMINLQTDEILAMPETDSDKSETYHSWSSNSKWFVYASKSGDGQFGKPWFCHADADGKLSKPFVLPQKSSLFYTRFLRSFNIPDLGKESVPFSAEAVGAMCREMENESFE